jgi:hypothetical protein
MENTDEWRVISRAPEYSINRHGVIVRTVAKARTRAGKVIKHWKMGEYPGVALRHDGRYVKTKVHRLVCEAFHGPPPTPAHHAAHNDGNPANCHADNLRWATPTENNRDKFRHGSNRITANKLTAEQVGVIRQIDPALESHRSVARRYGVTDSLICVIRNPNKRHWDNVPFGDWAKRLKHI